MRGNPTRMSFLLSSRVRRWVILAIAVPLGSWLLAKVAERVRERRGDDSKIAKALSAGRRTGVNAEPPRPRSPASSGQRAHDRRIRQ